MQPRKACLRGKFLLLFKYFQAQRGLNYELGIFTATVTMKLINSPV